MNIRLASELPNDFAAALESPHEKKFVYSNCNMSYTDHDNNKRSSKEFEKDLNYKTGSYTTATIMDYQTGGQTPDINQARVTRSSTDVSEYSNYPKDQNIQDTISR